MHFTFNVDVGRVVNEGLICMLRECTSSMHCNDHLVKVLLDGSRGARLPDSRDVFPPFVSWDRQ
jgi:hypothetical protein